MYQIGSTRNVLSLSVGLVLSLTSFAARANGGRYNSPPIPYDTINQAQAQAKRNCSGNNSGGGQSGQQKNQPQPPLTTVTCGQVVTSSITMANDLNCPSSTGFALSVVGNNITINGNNHLITAPLADAGIFVNGSGITVQQVKVRGISQGVGITAYDSTNLTISQNDVSSNYVGIRVYTDSPEVKNVSIVGNRGENCEIGFESLLDAPGIIDAPYIVNNDFSYSLSYAMIITASSFELTNANVNNLTGSLDGIYLAKGNFYIHDLQMAAQEISGTEIFIDSAPQVTVVNTDLSSNLAHQSTDSQIGLDLFRCQEFSISSFTSNGNDVGIKLETETGVSSTGTVQCSSFSHNYTAAIMASSYDSTIYGNIYLVSDLINEPAGATSWLDSGTTSEPIVSNSVNCNGSSHGSGGGGGCGH